MAHTEIDITSPADIDIVRADDVRDVKSQIMERLGLEHDIDGGTDDTGYHFKLTMEELASYDGADLNLDAVYSKVEDDVGVLHTKDVDGVTELFYFCKIDNALGIPEHYEIQMTSNGGIIK